MKPIYKPKGAAADHRERAVNDEIEQRPLREIAADLLKWTRKRLKAETEIHFLECELLAALSKDESTAAMQESPKAARESDELASPRELAVLWELAKPLIEYLRKNHHPHTAIVVTDERVTLSEDVMSVPFEQGD